jgi:hypothetical protein
MKKLLILAALLLAVDVVPAQLQAQTTPAATARPRRQRDRISHDEVVQSSATTAYDLVQGLRPMWFNRSQGRLTNAPSSPGDEASQGLIIILDTSVLGGKESLREVAIGQVYSVEFLTPAQAHMRYDRNSRDGAIVIHATAESDAAAHPNG